MEGSIDYDSRKSVVYRTGPARSEALFASTGDRLARAPRELLEQFGVRVNTVCITPVAQSNLPESLTKTVCYFSGTEGAINCVLRELSAMHASKLSTALRART